MLEYDFAPRGLGGAGRDDDGRWSSDLETTLRLQNLRRSRAHTRAPLWAAPPGQPRSSVSASRWRRSPRRRTPARPRPFATQARVARERRPGTARPVPSEHEGTTSTAEGGPRPARVRAAQAHRRQCARRDAADVLQRRRLQELRRDGGGTITKWEMMAMFRQALFIRKHELSDADIDAIYAVIDKDRSGSALPEFLEFVAGGHRRAARTRAARRSAELRLQRSTRRASSRTASSSTGAALHDEQARARHAQQLANAHLARGHRASRARAPLSSPKPSLPTPRPRDRSTVARARVPVPRAIGTPGQGRRAQPAPARARDVARALELEEGEADRRGPFNSGNVLLGGKLSTRDVSARSASARSARTRPTHTQLHLMQRMGGECAERARCGRGSRVSSTLARLQRRVGAAHGSGAVWLSRRIQRAHERAARRARAGARRSPAMPFVSRKRSQRRVP